MPSAKMHTRRYWFIFSGAGCLFVLCSASKNNIKNIPNLIKNVFDLHGGEQKDKSQTSNMRKRIRNELIKNNCSQTCEFLFSSSYEQDILF